MRPQQAFERPKHGPPAPGKACQSRGLSIQQAPVFGYQNRRLLCDPNRMEETRRLEKQKKTVAW